MIYLDHAATTLKKPQGVYDAVLRAMQSHGNSGRSCGAASLRAAREIYQARSLLCEFFGGRDPARLVFTANATESLNIAIHGLIEPGDHVISTDLEHNSVLRPLYEREAQGSELTIVKSGADGRLSPERIEAAVRPNTRAIVCTHASNLTGIAVDIGRIGEMTRRRGLLLIVDASQTAGILPIDVEKMKIDVLCFTGHKSLFGPQGTGGMYVGERADIRPLLSGGTGVQSFLRHQPEELPERLEAGTLNAHGIAGLLAGVRWISETGTDRIYQREHALMMRFYTAVREIEDVHLYGTFDGVHCPVVSLNIGSLDSAEVSDWLSEEYGIVTRPGAHCAPLMHAHFGTQRQGMVRFSFSYFNKEEEVSRAAEAVAELAAQSRVCG